MTYLLSVVKHLFVLDNKNVSKMDIKISKLEDIYIFLKLKEGIVLFLICTFILPMGISSLFLLNIIFIQNNRAKCLTVFKILYSAM